MKIQINVKMACNPGTTTALDLIVGITDTVSSVKVRVGSMQQIPFPEKDLMLNGAVLEDVKELAECGVRELSCLDLVVKASEAVVLAQLSALLQSRDLSCDELGLLYCYKHGVSVTAALKSIGSEEKFQDFIKRQKLFSVENGRVAAVRQETSPKPLAVAGAGDRVALKSAQSPKKERQRQRPRSPVEAALTAAGSADSQQYMDLHTKISGRSFNSKVSQAVSDVVELISQKTFLNAERIVKGGSVGKGTAISDGTDAEIVVFLKGLPSAGHDKWLPPLLKAVAGALTEHLGGESGLETVHTTEDSVQLLVKGFLTVDLRFSPVFSSYAETIQVFGEQGPEARRLFATSLVNERSQFIAKQPSHVKVTIRLLKWWRDQQDWSSKMVRPTDEILELIAIYSAVQTKPADQRLAIANVMSFLSRFSELRIVWSNFYGMGDVWAPLLNQRPLLMDPVNPFVNVADPQAFDARELMELAKTTHFFW